MGVVCDSESDMGEVAAVAVTCGYASGCEEEEEEVREGIALRGSYSGVMEISPTEVSLRAFSSSLRFRQAAFGLRLRTEEEMGTVTS